MASAKRWAGIISYIASRAYFCLIILQVPLFRVPCRAGICTTPIEVTSCPLIASEACPAVVVKSLMYPGAVVDAILRNKTIPNFHKLLYTHPNFKMFEDFDETIDLRHIEVLVGSYFSVAGALLGCLRPGRMSLLGTLLLLWGLTKELFFGRHEQRDPTKAVYVYPTMLIASILAFLSIKGDVRKIIRSFKPKRLTKLKFN